MRVEIRLGRRTLRRWQQVLIERLRALDEVEVGVRVVDEPVCPTQRSWERLLRLERRLYGLDDGLLAVARIESEVPDAWEPDTIVDLTSAPLRGAWAVRYEDGWGECAAAAALRTGGFPVVTVLDGTGDIRAQGRPGSEVPGLFATALADLSAGVVALIVGALAGRDFAPPADAPRPSGRNRSLTEIGIRRVAGAMARHAYRLLYRAPHWRVGWRRVDGAGTVAEDALPQGPWHDLPDDGLRFYADPFPFEHEGRAYLFVEDFEHSVGRAGISVVPWTEDGPDGVPVPVLEHDVHLSYPFVLEHDGDVWMIPETSGARTVELYRAVRFPWTWERHSILLEDVEASDSTPFRHGGRWWLTATVGDGGSLSDSLWLWSAPDLRGPWSPHRNNPVLVDIASARPAGRVVQHEGRLLRPVQDCRAGYGAALAVAEITRLDDEAFEQCVIRRFAPGEAWPGTRLHTLNTGGGIETVDGSAFAPRFRRRRAAPSRQPEAR
ncbi:hypothetical protein ACFVAE_07030 [Microbacterium sp. NPDC057659]|uniref:glucosamine inositolphosphorylceramide transferase family protein n=1 Tax=Microbacterium sp. NPDC057659 TaxID=3346198 RepID=UPI00366B0704